MKLFRIKADGPVNFLWVYKVKILSLLFMALFTFTAIFANFDGKKFLAADSTPINAHYFLNELIPPLQQGLSVHNIHRGETLYRLSREYFVSLQELIAINKISNTAEIMVGQKILIPGIVPARGFVTQKPLYAPLSNQVEKSINLITPVQGFISSGFGPRWGRMHYGLDLAAPFGAKVKAAASGQVIFAGWNGSYGLFIELNHGNIKTLYAHLSRILVKKGNIVRQGQVIGLVGATGRAFGSHLHFEVESHGKKVNPFSYLTQLRERM